ncbi:hypothetical protein ACFX2A_025046 [Malus domestica]
MFLRLGNLEGSLGVWLFTRNLDLVAVVSSLVRSEQWRKFARVNADGAWKDGSLQGSGVILHDSNGSFRS